MTINKFIKSVCYALVVALVALLLLLALAPLALPAERAVNDNDVYNACCRVYSGAYAGSGTAFMEHNGKIYILTNYHVVADRDATVQFFGDGQASERIEAKNVARGYNNNSSLDYAILSIDATSRVKNLVPLWRGSEPYRFNSAIIGTTGCPRAEYLRTIRGLVYSHNAGDNITFSPTPYGGQSGSSIVSYTNGLPYIVALLTWRTDEEGRESAGGLAQPIERVISDLEGTATASASIGDARRKTLEWSLEAGKSLDAEPPTNDDREVLLNGGAIRAVELATSKPILDFYTLGAGCAPCMKLESDISRGVFNGFTINKRGQSASVRSYPYIRVLAPDGSVIQSFTGYDETTKELILSVGSKYIIREQEEPLRPTRSGSLPFTIPRTDRDGAPTEPKQEPKQEKKSEEDRLFNFGLIDNLKNSIKDELDRSASGILGTILEEAERKTKELVKALTLPLFFLIVAACILANAITKTTIVVIKKLWSLVKSGFSLLGCIILNRFNKLDEKIAELIAEKIKEVDKIKTSKK